MQKTKVSSNRFVISLNNEEIVSSLKETIIKEHPQLKDVEFSVRVKTCYGEFTASTEVLLF